MSKKNKIDKKIQKNIAKKRIDKLFLMAEEKAFENKFNLANRYVELARKLSMRYLVPMPKEYKTRFCKHCYSYLLPDVTSRVRINRGKLVVFCNNCQKFTRIPIKNKSK